MPKFSRLLSVRSLLRSAVLALSLACAGPALANDPNGATIQWAQQILDKAGFYNGRAHGRMDAATATAISNYQRSVGLKATGRLDQATIDRMLADRQAQETPTMGNLADPGARARPSAPILREQDVLPQAAPSAPGVQVDGAAIPPSVAEDGGRIAAPAAAGSAPAVTGGDVQPQAAARAGVEVEGGQPASPLFDLQNLTAPGWVRYALLGLIGGVLVLMAGIWAFSGRRSSKPRVGARGTPASRGAVARPEGRKSGMAVSPGGAASAVSLSAAPLPAGSRSSTSLSAAAIGPASPRSASRPAAPASTARPAAGTRQPPSLGPAPAPQGTTRREPSFGSPAPQQGMPGPTGLRGGRR